MKDFRLASQNVIVMWNFCTIFQVENIDVGQMCILYRKLYIVYSKRWVRNNRKDDNGFEYLSNWLTFVVTVVSWILYVGNGRKINSLSDCFK
jgi:hypothetical protein